MQIFETKQFHIPALSGISDKNIQEHLKLYAGYVKSANHIQEKINTLLNDAEANAYEIGELNRRFSFEFNGMKNHQYYFEGFVGGVMELGAKSLLYSKIESDFGNFENFMHRFKTTATTRGIGWCMLGYDTQNDKLIIYWVDEQHLGQLSEVKIILALDMWEHAFVYDYPTSEKKKYIEAFFENLNWNTIEKRF